MDSSNAEKAARAAYIAFHEGLSGFDAARAWDDMTSPADDWSQEAIDWTHAIKAALSSRDAEVAELTRLLAESRAANGDSEARRAELEATVQAMGEATDIRHGSKLDRLDRIAMLYAAAPSVVLEDRDREVAARTLEEAADHYHADLSLGPEWRPVGWANRLRQRAAAIRKGDNA